MKWFASVTLVLFLAAACDVEESRQTGENGLTVPMVARDAESAATDTPVPADPSGFKITFIDVGQGDATLVEVDGELLLIDGGRSKARIKERLQALGVTDLDAIVATHPDADHIAGLIEVLAMFQVERIYLNGGVGTSQTFADLMAAVNTEGVVVVTLTRGQTIPLGGLQLDVLHPATLSGDLNEDSLVFLLQCGTVDVLLAGDATTASRRRCWPLRTSRMGMFSRLGITAPALPARQHFLTLPCRSSRLSAQV